MKRGLLWLNLGWATRGRTVTVTAIVTAVAALLLPLRGAALPHVAPESTAPPAITGTAATGETLVASTGTWTGTQPISFAFQWQRCDSSGAACVSIVGATNTTYVVQAADTGNRLRVRVTASNSDGVASALSDATAVVAAGGAPMRTAEPTITGSPVEGQRLTASAGTWSGTQPITFAYQWVRCPTNGGAPDGSNCGVLPGANSTTYTLVASDVGSRMRVRVTATNSAGTALAASNATGVVQTGRAPVNTVRPRVSGTWIEGSLATVSRGTWTGATSFAYQWVRCNSAGGSCVPIAGATSTQYRLTASDIGHKIRVNVTARNSRGSTTVLSTESGTVAAAGPAGVIVLPSGERSIPVTSVPATARLVVEQVRFTPNPVRSRTAPFTVRVRVKDTRGYVVRDALVFTRSTPLVTRAAQPRRTTFADGWVTFAMTPRSTFPTPRSGFNVQFFVKAYRSSDPPLGGVAGYRLVQVRLAG
ncbi:MAG TPA: hypothetical protein VMK83_00650 [Gaiellaceae bacterium]|nr:hypothetical protein [Gaiellaceae bacterium]